MSHAVVKTEIKPFELKFICKNNTTTHNSKNIVH